MPVNAEQTSQGNFLASPGGVWAGQRFLEKGLSLSALRPNDTMPRDAWVHFVDVAVREGLTRLRAVQDLVNAGLTRNVSNAMGRTMVEYEKVADMGPADRNMDAISRSTLDRMDFTQVQVPNHITHKDFDLSIRTLRASQNSGEPLDTTQVGNAARRVAESLEDALFNGTGVTVNGVTAPGYTTHADRNTAAFGTGGAWTGTKTGAQVLTDAFTMIAALEGDRHYGPYWIYVPTNSSTFLENDFKVESDLTIRDRLLSIGGDANEGVTQVRVVDTLADDNVVMVSATRDVVELADGEGIQPVQWDVMGGMLLKFKVMAIQIPLVKSDASLRSGIFHMS